MQSPDQAAQDWVSGISAKTEKMKAGAQAVKVAPGQAAANNKAGYLAGVQANVDTWARNVAAVSREQWISDFVNKGVPRIATGASQAQAKMSAVFQQLFPHIEQSVSRLPPRGTYEQNKARANAMMDAMHGFKMRR